MARLGEIKHNRKKARRFAHYGEHSGAGTLMQARRYKGTVKFEVTRTKSGRSAYLANACMFDSAKRVTMSARISGRWQRHRDRCAVGAGSTPTKAVKQALGRLTKKIR